MNQKKYLMDFLLQQLLQLMILIMLQFGIYVEHTLVKIMIIYVQ